jgi:hypothetical protein
MMKHHITMRLKINSPLDAAAAVAREVEEAAMR